MQVLFKNRYIIDFVATVMFFTRIPVNWAFFSDEAPNLTRAAWAFPLIGYFIGFCSGIIGDIGLFFGLSTFVSCILAIIFSVILSGAFHEDGLADMADGFGAGGSPERVNEIMHDSRLGTYGVTALTLGLFAWIIGIGSVLSFNDWSDISFIGDLNFLDSSFISIIHTDGTKEIYEKKRKKKVIDNDVCLIE